MKSKTSVLLFLLGLFSMTEVRIIGSMAISELLIFILAPFVFIADIATLRRDGFMPLIGLISATMVSCIVSSVANETYLPMAERGVATIYAMFAITVVMHRIIRDNMNGVRWFILGYSLSLVVNIFVFQKSTEIGRAMGGDVTETILTNQFLWVSRVGDWLLTPVQVWFLQTPLLYSILAPIGFAVFFMLSSESGRSAALVNVASSVMIFIGGKKRSRMDIMKKHFGVMVLIAVILLLLIKVGYTYSAKNGILGEKTQQKYEAQTGGRDSALAILMGGRSDFFMGLAAAVRKPILGYGPWPIDYDHIAVQFLYKHGSAEDITKYEQLKLNMVRLGMPEALGWIPTHSHLIGFWVWYGLPGLILWIYVLFVMVKVVKLGLSAVPQWYGLMCIFIPSMMWHLFFSPFGSRVFRMTLFVCVFLLKAVAEGRMRLPPQMDMEALKYDRK